jgi:hypothetical protein
MFWISRGLHNLTSALATSKARGACMWEEDEGRPVEIIYRSWNPFMYPDIPSALCPAKLHRQWDDMIADNEYEVALNK